jgi:hypothetical protein
VAGALLEAELAEIVEGSGFEGFSITWKAAVFDGAPQSSSAKSFDTVGINFTARKPA